jgi:hypothetical protein
MLTRDGAQKLAYRVPWLYHVVHRSDEGARETIGSDGLTPGRSRHCWHPTFKPRQGHVYLATHRYLTAAPWNLWRKGDDLYAVDVGCLVPARINPDEDHFIEGGTGACDKFRLPRPAGQDLWKLFGPKFVPSYGDWADQVDLGSHPTHTAYSASRGSLAYSGVVPPKALRRWDEVSRQWTGRSETPSGGSLPSSTKEPDEH